MAEFFFPTRKDIVKRVYHNRKAPKAFIVVGWIDSETNKLIRLWNDGLTSGQISVLFVGKTRNSIIGKITRLRRRGAELIDHKRTISPQPTRIRKRANIVRPVIHAEDHEFYDDTITEMMREGFR